MIDSKPLASGAFNPVSLKTDGLGVRMGLPMWFHPQWQGRLLTDRATGTDALSEYSRVFSSVEGNTTFYALPSKPRLLQWLRAVPGNFQFCFKVPKAISHTPDPVKAWSGQEGNRWRAFIDAILDEAPGKLGVLILQLPPGFSSRRMELLMRLMDEFVRLESVHWAIECRHLSFFDKGKNESTLLRAMADRGINRVIFDTRGLITDDSQDEAVLDARGKKPRMPVHPVATGQRPLVRFIGHSVFEHNLTYLGQWQGKLSSWGAEGREPVVFWHTAGNSDVPEFYRKTLQHWKLEVPVWPGEEVQTGDNLGFWD